MLFVPPARERDPVRVSGPPSVRPGELGANSAKANVVVPVVRPVVVAIGRPAVDGVVVPTAAANHAVRTLWTKPPLRL